MEKLQPHNHQTPMISSDRCRKGGDRTSLTLDTEFEALYTDFGRPSIAPERLIRASLLQILFSVRVTPQACFQHDAAADGADAV